MLKINLLEKIKEKNQTKIKTLVDELANLRQSEPKKNLPSESMPVYTREVSTRLSIASLQKQTILSQTTDLVKLSKHPMPK